jgi:hypothetical protein
MYHSKAGGGSKSQLENQEFRARWNKLVRAQGVDPELVYLELDRSGALSS